MTSVLVLTICRRYCLILPFKAGMIVTLQRFSTYYPLPINGRYTHRAHLWRIQRCQGELFFLHISHQVHHLRETHVHRMCRSMKLTSLRDASEGFRTHNFGQLFRAAIEEDWAQDVCGLVLGYHLNAVKVSIPITFQNGLLYCGQPFYFPTSVELLGLDYKVAYTNANQGIMPESHNIWVQYMEHDLNNTFQGRICSFPVLYFRWTPSNQILQFQECLPTRQMMSTFSKRCKKAQQWIFHTRAQQYVVVIPTKYHNLHSWAHSVVGCIRVVKQTDKIINVPVRAIVGPAHLVRENSASDSIDNIWLVTNHVDLGTHWTVY